MKFNQSERQLHKAQSYTPACNYYEPYSAEGKIVTGSLTGPILAKEPNCFGLAARFNTSSERVPGPGSYNNQKHDQKQTPAVINGIKLRQYKKHALFSIEQRSPSIPYNQFKFDDQDMQLVKQLLISEDINKSALQLKRNNQGYTFSKANLKSGKVKYQQQEIPVQSMLEYTIKQQKKAKANQMKEKVKRANQKRNQIINLINPQFVPSLELIQLITKRRTKYNPGPGAYNSTEGENIIRPVEHGQSFPATKRFSEQKKSLIGPGEYKIQETKKKNISFSKSARTLFNLKSDTDLEHRFYIDPYETNKKNDSRTIQSQKQQRPFGSQVVRFSKLQREPLTYEDSYRAKKSFKLQQVIDKKLKMIQIQRRRTVQSKGLLDISTMASTIQ